MFLKIFCITKFEKIYTLAICCWSEILHLITKHVWEALWSWRWWHSFQYLVISYKKGTGWTPLVSFLRPLITSAILAAVWREIKTRVGYFKQLVHFFFLFFFPLEVVAFGIFTALLERGGSMAKGQPRKKYYSFPTSLSLVWWRKNLLFHLKKSQIKESWLSTPSTCYPIFYRCNWGLLGWTIILPLYNSVVDITDYG